jgi:hypothetical protein
MSDGMDEAAKAIFDMNQRRQGIDPEGEAAEPEPAPEGEPEGESAEPEAEPAGDAEPESESEGEPEEPTLKLEDGTEITAHELKRGWLREADYTRKAMELAQQRATFEATQRAHQTAIEQRMQQVNGIAEQLQFEMAQLMPSAIELQRLRVEDPAEFSAKMMEIQRRQNLFATVQATRNQMMQEAAARAEQERQARIPQEVASLQAAVPAFKKDFATEYESLGRYALAPDGGNLRPEEWEQLIDHRHVTLVWKAREYDKATRKTQPEVHGKLAQKPRTIRPGASTRGTGDTMERELKAAMDQLNKNPDSTEAIQRMFEVRERAKRARMPGRRGPT